MMQHYDTHEGVRDAVLSAPPTAVAGLALMGITLQDWVLMATLLWLGLQIAWFGYKRYQDFMDKDDKCDGDEDG